MRTAFVLGVLSLVLVARWQPPHGQPAAETAPLVTAETLVGAWNGQWAATPGEARGGVGLVLARVPGRDGVIGQFTFLTGGASRTVRYEGQLRDGVLYFPLVGEGRIVLEPQEATRPEGAVSLRGAWRDVRGALPASAGILQLTRAPVR